MSFKFMSGGPGLGRPPGAPRNWTLNDFLFPGDASSKDAPPLSPTEYEQQLIKAAQRVKNGDGFPLDPEIRLQVQNVIPYVVANPAASSTTPWGIPRNNKPVPAPPSFTPPKPMASTTSVGSTDAARPHSAGRPIFDPTTRPNPATPSSVRHQHQVAAKQQRYSSSDTSVITFDLEITSLNSRMVYNPSELAWQTDLEKLVAITNNTKDIQKRAAAARELEFYKYYEPLGLAQIAVQGGEFDKRSLTEIARGKSWKGVNPNGYVVWSDDLARDPAALMGMLGSWDDKSAKYIGSIFANRQGITSRSMEALMAAGPDGSPQVLGQSEAVVAFFKGVKADLDAGKKIVFRNQNAWFDVLGMVGLAVRHQDAMFAAGLDPLMLVDAYREGKMTVHSTEEIFFDLLRSKGLNDPEWAAKHLKFGKMGATIFEGTVPGAGPGKPIDMVEEMNRFLRGEQSMMRGRPGWNMEVISQSFGQHIDFSKVSKEEFGGRTWEELSKLPLHDAVKDTAVSTVISGRMERSLEIQRELAALSATRNLDSRTIEAIAAARAGLLGEEFDLGAKAATNLGVYVDELTRSGKLALALARHDNTWSTWVGLTSKSMAGAERIAAGTIRSPLEYLTLGQRISRSATNAGLTALNALKNIPAKPQAFAGTVVAGVVLTAGAMALFRRGKRIQANLPPTYLPGQQAKNKPIKVPWSSPWHGPDRDVRNANQNFQYQGRRDDDQNVDVTPSRAETNLIVDVIAGILSRGARMGVPFGSPWHGIPDDAEKAKYETDRKVKAGVKLGVGFGAWWLSQNIWGLMGTQEWGRKITEKAYFISRWIEDAFPLRVGRMFGHSSHISSFLAPTNLDVRVSHLLNSGQLTVVGEAYAHGMGLDKLEFEQYLRESGEEFLHFERHGFLPYHEIDLGALGKHHVRMFQGGSYQGKVMAGYGASDVHLRPNRPFWHADQQAMHFASSGKVPKPLRKVFQWLWGKKAFRERFRNIESKAYYDVDLVNKHYISGQVGDQLWMPGYEAPLDAVAKLFREGETRAAGRALRRYFSSSFYTWTHPAWNLLRRTIGNLSGHDIGPAASYRKIVKGTARFGAKLYGGIVAFNLVNDTLGGKLTTPLWNARDRLMIGHAWVSDKLGLTKLKKRQKRQGTFASLAWGLLPITSLLAGTYLYRVTKLGRDLERAQTYYRETRHLRGGRPNPGGGRLDFRPGGRLEKIVSADGKRVVRRWVPGTRRLMHEVGTPRITKGIGADTNIVAARLLKLLTKKTGAGRRLTGAGWAAVGVWAAVTALFLPFLGSSETVQERKDRIAGKRKVPVRSGQFFEFGSQRYEGGKIKYWRLDASARHRLRADRRVAGNRGGLLGALHSLVNPYWREKSSYSDRPYPITGTPLQDVPFVGALLGRTVGRFFKPPKLMHSKEWQPGQPYQEFNDWTEPRPEMGGLSPDKPANPLGWRAQIRAGVYNYTKLMGFMGAVLQHHVVNTIWGTGEAPYGYAPELAQPRFGSFTDRYWEGAFGGGGAKGDLFRRFFPRRQQGIQIDPLKNKMPTWMPGPEYLVDFQHGDPYCLTGSTYVESDSLQFLRADEVIRGTKLVDANGSGVEVTATKSREVGPVIKVTLSTLPAFPTTASPDHPYLARCLVKGRRRKVRSELYRHANRLLARTINGASRIEAAHQAGVDDSQACAAWKLLEKHHKITIDRKGRRGTVIVLDPEPFDEALLDHGLVFIRAEDLKTGDYLAYPRPILDESVDSIDISKLGQWSAVTDQFVYYRGSQDHDENLEYLLDERPVPGNESTLYQARSSLKQGFFPQRFPRYVRLTPELGRFIGLWLAEGSCTLSGAINTAHHARERDVVERIYRDAGLSPVWRPVPGTDGASMTIGSRGMATLLEYLCGRLAKHKCLDDAVFHAPRLFIRALLDGYFFGDGCEFVSNGRWRKSAVTASPILALQIRKLLLALGVVAGVVHRPPQGVSGDSWQININNQDGKTTWFADDNFYYFRINEIEPAGQEQTYGFSTESATFCAVGVATHNTKIDEGEYRLPGKGFERVHPELKGVDPEKYPAWAKHEILADVAPWSKQYYQARDEAGMAARTNARLSAKYEAIEKQAEEQRRRETFDDRSFTEKTDRVRGKVSEVLPDGHFRLAEYPNHTFRMAGASFGIDAVSEQLRAQNHWTKEKAVDVAGEQQSERDAWLQKQLVGRNVSVMVHHGGLGRPEVEGELFVGGDSFAQRAVEHGYAGTDGEGRYQAGLLGRIYGSAVERVSHIPQHVPGPWFLHSKLNNVADPIEAYRRDQLYGTKERSWTKPWDDFLRPYLFQGIAKLTPGDYVPPHVQERRDIDTLYDRLAYLKAYKNNDQMGMARTAIGVNDEAPTGQVATAMPYRERPYFDAFAEETDPSKRKKIMGIVSPDMQKALVGQWTRDYNESLGVQAPMNPTTMNPVAAAAQAVTDIHDAGYQVPESDWVGWNQGADLADVQAIQIRSEGLEAHEFNVWDDRLASLSRKPYLNGAYEHLCSRPLLDSIPILSSDVRGSAIQGRHISPSRSASADIQFQVDNSSDDRRRQRHAMGSMIG